MIPPQFDKQARIIFHIINRRNSIKSAHINIKQNSKQSKSTTNDNQMGNKTQTISYSCGSKYVGDVSNMVPNGKGTIYIHKDSPSFQSLSNKLNVDEDNFSAIEVLYENGKILKCKLNLKNGLVFEGTLDQNNSFNGEGKLVDQQKVVYEGTFNNGKLTKGKIDSSNTSDPNKIAYVCETQGSFIGTSIINGQSTFLNITDNFLASGDFHKGKQSKGFYLFASGEQYEGDFSQGVPHGNGTYRTFSYASKKNAAPESNPISSNKMAQEFMHRIKASQKSGQFQLTGAFQNGNPNGKGQAHFPNGDSYKGRLKDGQIHGQGEYTFADGTIYKGGFYSGSMNGDCTIEYNEKSKINENKKRHEILEKYEGEVSNGVFHGLGILYYRNGVIFKGYFLDGAKNGPGVLIFCQNKYKCLYIMNKLVGELKLIAESS